MNLSTFQKQVADWGTKTFPDATADTIADHLAEEMIELLGTERVGTAYIRAIKANDMEDAPPTANPAEESSDILLMLLHMAYRFDFDLMEEARKKFDEVKNAEWIDDGRGYKKRVKV